MHVLLALIWLAAPLAPINPIQQDTLPAVSLHVSAGVAVDNGILSTGPLIGVKYEWRVVHPLVLRGGFDFRVGQAETRIWPNGSLEPSAVITGPFQSMAIDLDIFYYRGTNKLMGYIGVGAICSFERYSANDASAASLRHDFGIDQVGMSQQFGYSLLLGLRFKKSYSFEIGISELRPDVTYAGHRSSASYVTGVSETRLGSFRVSLGHIWTIRGT